MAKEGTTSATFFAAFAELLKKEFPKLPKPLRIAILVAAVTVFPLAYVAYGYLTTEHSKPTNRHAITGAILEESPVDSSTGDHRTGDRSAGAGAEIKDSRFDTGDHQTGNHSIGDHPEIKDSTLDLSSHTQEEINAMVSSIKNGIGMALNVTLNLVARESVFLAFKPIPNLSERLASIHFPNDGQGEPISVHFVSTEWGIDTHWTFPRATKVGTVSETIIKRLQLREYVLVQEPKHEVGSWGIAWQLCIDGEPLDDEADFSDARDGALVNLKIQVGFSQNCEAQFDNLFAQQRIDLHQALKMLLNDPVLAQKMRDFRRDAEPAEKPADADPAVR